MNNKFSVEELIIKVMPGGFLLAILYFLFLDKIQFNLIDNLDFFYTFLFFCSAYIIGELLQTIAHEIEWIIDIFFKLRRPSEIFLYKNNPVIKSEYKRSELMKELKLEETESKLFDQKYSELSFWRWKKNKKSDEISQSIFWRLYSKVNQADEIKTANRDYLFVRVIMLEFLIIGIFLIIDKNYYWSILSFLFCIIFLWRSRGVARGLIFKTILLNLKNNWYEKIVILNVGGALSSYAEIDNKKIVIDLGKSSDFSPVDNFLMPLAQRWSFKKSDNPGNTDKYHVDQLFLSHLDNDHISDYELFKEKFHPNYMTCPNDNETQDSIFKIIISFFTGKNNTRNLILSDMKERTSNVPDNPYNMSPSNPLVSTMPEIIKLFYIIPTECGNDENLKSGYANNISLILFFYLGNKTLLMPGDILKEGMEYLIEHNSDFKKQLNDFGVDFLIAPHHGLTTSFSERLFQEMKGNKTRLNIISEEVREEDSNENRSDVDKRYYDSNYSSGENSLKQNAVKTSMGHIVIDLETDETEIKQYADIDDVLKEFISASNL